MRHLPSNGGWPGRQAAGTSRHAQDKDHDALL
jgi:hypothetical protein